MDNFGDQFVRTGTSVQSALLKKGVLVFWLGFYVAKSMAYRRARERAVKIDLQVMRYIPEGYMGTIFNSLQKYRSCA